MLDRLKQLFAPPATPIGVDFGTAALRLAQVEPFGDGVRLVAAATVEVPASANASPAARDAFFVPAVKRMLADAPFRGRRAVPAVPAAATHCEHLRMARMTPDRTAAALAAEAAGRLPFDPATAVLRHLVAGDVHAAGTGGAAEPRQEVVLLATPRAQVDHLLSSASRAGLDVVGLEAECPAVVAAFGRGYRRAIDREQGLMFVDLGRDRTRATVARGGRVLFARSIDFGAADVERSVPATGATRGATRDATPDAAPGPAVDAALDLALRPAVARLVDELSACRRYHETTFPDRPVERLVFLGGGARATALCLGVARGMRLSAGVADPLLGVARPADPASNPAAASAAGPAAVAWLAAAGLGSPGPHPEWFVAVGLSRNAVADGRSARRAA